MKTTKLTRTLFAGMMTCSMALTAVSVSSFVAPGAIQTVLAEEETPTPAPETFTLNLHKLKVYDGREYENTGKPDIPGVDLDGLPGVQFEIYNVTKEFYAARDDEKNKDLSNKELAALLSDGWDYDNPTGKYVATKTTDEDGIATHELDTRTELDGNMVHSVYMFVELEGDANTAFMTARPFLLGMSDDLARQDSVDLFAKNYGVQKDLLGEDDEPLEGDYYSYNVGDKLQYVSTSPMPTKRAIVEEGYTGLRFFDEMTEAGTDLVSIDDIYYETTDENGDVTKHSVKTEFDYAFDLITSNDDGWVTETRKNAGFEYSVDWTERNPEWSEDRIETLELLLLELAGKKLHFKYTMTINNEATPYQSIGNKFYGSFTNKHDTYHTVDDAPEVETGGFKFVKKDAETKKGLDDAHFKITRQNGNVTEYARLMDNDKKEITSDNGIYKPDVIEWTTEARGTTIISANKGQLAVYGLETNTYQLVETKAPTGYTFKEANTEFKVYEASVTTQELDSKDVLNYGNEPILPITGGIGIISFLAVGAAAMGGALYLKKKKA